MSCEDCEKAQESPHSFFYRIENANVEVKGCRKHVAMMFEMIDGRQRDQEQNEDDHTEDCAAVQDAGDL